ncbi:MAG: LysE family translocator [Chloroflexota bacterium]
MDLFDARFASYLALSALLIVIPGPDMALVTRNALTAGRHATSSTAAGVALGILGWAIASAFGVGLLLERSVFIFTLLKLAGAVYLGYLGVHSLIDSFKSGRPVIGPHNSSPAPRALRRIDAFTQGILCNLLNPKAAVIFVTVLPQFVRRGDSPLRLILMVLAFEVMLLAWLNLYGYLISRVGRGQSGIRIRRAMERVTGVALIGLGVRLAIERR